jgi:uncharacterized protein (DUF1330 family)
MRTTIAIGLGIALGVGGATVISAQTKPPAYSLSEISYIDEDGYGKDYAVKMLPLIEKHGGKVIVRRTTNIVAVPGTTDAPKVVTMIQFPNMDQAKTWIADPDVAALRPLRDKVAKLRTFLFEGSN